ncbi:MAG: nitroreductase family protein, partial [Firmicutes bacterium]|nr:nitroreductase family protein [Bacillota bacterium]
MTFLDLAQSRYSVRKYSDKPVEKEKLEQILKAAQAAPTACNYQPWRVSVLQSPEAIAKVRSLTRYAFNAPVV